MIFETTHDYAVTVPLMISNLVSFFISSRMQRQPIYEVLAEQDGVHLPREATRQRRGQRPVAEIMRAATEVVPADSTVREVFETKKDGELHAWPVRDGSGVIGMTSLAALQRAIASGDENKHLGELIAGPDFPHVHPDHPLDLALERMGTTKLDVLPVVSRADLHRILGVVVLPDILKAFGIDRESANFTA